MNRPDDPAQADALIDTAAGWQLRLAEDADARPAFEAWRDASPAHRAAFERVAHGWNLFGGERAGDALRLAAAEARTAAHAARRRRRSRQAAGAFAAIAASLVLALLVWPWLDAADVYRTGVGERRMVTLADGSQLTLDGASTVRVRYRRGARELWLDQGQARFDVARDPARPFSVHAGSRVVTATGTAFNIDLMRGRVVVTMIEGHVRVTPAEAGRAAPAPVALRAGEQLAAQGAAGRIERVEVAGATAWQSGRLIFEDEPLALAVERVNRHVQRKIVLADTRARALRVSGVFKTAEADRFAEAVATYLPVAIVEQSAGRVTLAARAAPRR